MPQAEIEKVNGSEEEAHQEEIKRLKLQAETGFNAESARFLSGLELSPIQLIVNLGCGPGYDIGPLSKILASEGQIIAVDKEERSLRALPMAIEAFGLDGRVIPQLAEMAELDPGPHSGQVGLVYARFSLQYIPEQKWPQLGKVIKGFLKPQLEGIFACEEFLISTARTEPACQAYNDAIEWLRQLYYEKTWHFDMGDRLGDFCQATGLEIVTSNRDNPSVIRAGGDSPFKKAHEMIFLTRKEAMVETGIATTNQFDQKMAEITAHLYQPTTIAITPAVVQTTMAIRQP